MADFKILPIEIHVKILSYLGYRDVISCSLVSTNLNTICSDDYFWKRFCLEYWNISECTLPTWKAQFQVMFEDYGRYEDCYRDIKDSWEKILNFFEANCPAIRSSFKNTDFVTEEMLNEKEQELNLRIPNEFRCSLRIQNGQHSGYDGLLGHIMLSDITRSERLLTFREIFADGPWMNGLPVTQCAWTNVSQQILFADLVPLKSGNVFYNLLNSNKFFITATNFTEWLRNLAHDLLAQSYIIEDRRLLNFKKSCEDLTTDGITVSVRTTFLPEHSLMDDQKYLFTYRITLQMSKKAPSKSACKLLTRHWEIIDENGKIETVQGPGVVGDFPVLRPGTVYSWMSFTSFKTPKGYMKGFFSMTNLKTGDITKVICPLFTMVALPTVDFGPDLIPKTF